MKVLRWITTVVFVGTLCLFSVFFWSEKNNRDNTWPSFQVPPGELAVSSRVTRQELLQGVTASDEKDGDLTDQIIVESISKFIRPGVCKITYTVVDHDNHVAKAVRTMHYQDYTPPKFYLKTPLFFYEDDKVNIREQIGAMDCIDGDISDRVTVTDTRHGSLNSDSFVLSVQVTNSHGDKVYADLPVYVAESAERDAEILLREPLIYVKQGERPDFKSYVTGVSLDGRSIPTYELKLSTNFDPATPGIYSVHLYAEAGDHTGHTVLTVIVEE